jgi:uncharacterized protein YgfB (UPF0149 family)
MTSIKHEAYYEEIQKIFLQQIGAGTSAECHGMLCAMLCLNPGITFDLWMERLKDISGGFTDTGNMSLLNQLFDNTRQQILNLDFSFELLLPDDGIPLFERATALAEWCQSFLAGMGFGSKTDRWTDSTHEILEDIVKISCLDPVAAGEADEVAFTELSEYVRVSVQIIFEDLQSRIVDKFK